MTIFAAARKIYDDAVIVAGIQMRIQKREWGAWIFILIFPLTMLFFANNASKGADMSAARLIAGTLVLSLGFSIVSELAKTLINERFNHQLQLMVVSPIHRASYACGVLALSGLRGLLSAAVLVLVTPFLGFSFDLSFWLIPASALTATSLVGIAMVIGTWAPSQRLGSMMAEMLGILVVMVSPIYFSADRFPGWLRWLPEISPYTHSADALTDALSGSGATIDVAILAAITALTLTVGVRAMRWRDI